MLNSVSLNLLVGDQNYQVTLQATDENNITKNIRMPVVINSDDGVFLSGLIAKAWNYIPDAAPDELSQAKARKLNAINSEWQQLLNAGWESGQGKLGLTSEDVALLAGNFALAKESAAMGGPVPPLISKENHIITFSNIQELITMMLSYGQARSTLSVQYSERIKAVENATTIEEIEGV